ncbi:alanine/glycine:cation symporter family protein [Frigidibacter sp. MR17.24]|uniref:alanine/glycine:cation symporter family protein n=1 Tax=Frigidibacter sp. MR17.24 TaxID=3127345 RepID=UPI003012F0E0
MDAIIDFLNTIFWGYVLIYGLLAVGLFFTIRLGFIQFRHFPEMIRCVMGSDESDKSGISPLQALTVSLASRVGTGNIAGVAVAIYLGGPGAVFWMWMVALVGMATAYSESTLAQLYKTHGTGGMYRGGPAFYIARGLGMPWLGAVFSICLIIAFGLVFNAVQANSIAEAFEGAFGVPKIAVGLVIAVLTAIIIFGGIPQIAKVAEIVVPFMAGIYLLLAIIVLAMNITAVPGAIGQIVGGAFGVGQAAGGIAGGIAAAALNGIKRGLFSNEAGMGSAPNIAAVATPDPHHPSSQGFVQALGVFIDTILVCTATAVMILLAGVVEPGSGVTGTALTQLALEHHFGSFGAVFVAVAIFFFAFTSIIGNYAYAENAMEFLGFGNRGGLLVLRIAALAMVVWGAVQAVATVFNFADASMGLMATINLIAIVALSGTVAAVTKSYLNQRLIGKQPRFHLSDHPGLMKGVDPTIWK